MPKIDPLVAIGIPTWGKVSMSWAQAYKRIGGPLGANVVELAPVVGKPIAEARNELVRSAIQNNCDFLFFLGDDVLAPPDSIHRMLQRMWDDPSLHLITGMYFTKQWPTQPYIWRGIQRGPYQDWKFGEFFEVDYSGIDCLMIRLSDEFKALGPDWFSTDWRWEGLDQDAPVLLATEDFYFFTRTRKAGLHLFCDSNIQCLHEDRVSGVQFGLTTEMPQYGLSNEPEYTVEAATDIAPLLKVADLGCGFDNKYWGKEEDVKVVRFDTNAKTKPDFRCDLHQIPVPDQSFDIVHSKHVLEHFGRDELPRLMKEWLRILRVGGEFRIQVPNVLDGFTQILLMEEQLVPVDPYPWWQVYGQQLDQYDVHKNGFTPRKLKLLFEGLGLEDVEVKTSGTETQPNLNIDATGRKVKHVTTFALLPEWDSIEKMESMQMDGLSQREEPVKIKRSRNGHKPELVTA